MVALYLVLCVVALVLFGLATFAVATTKYNLMAGGLFFLTLVFTLQWLQKV